MLEQLLQEELNRFNAINKYANKLVMEQDVPPPPPPAGGEVPPPPGGDVPPPAGGEVPPPPGGDVPPPAGGEETEEIDITDLVNMTKNIKKELDNNKQDNSSVTTKMDDVFTKLTDLEQKLQQMDNIVAKIESLSGQVQQMKPETPQEKLEMRSLDSYPFNQKPNDFFTKKQEEMRMSGKNEYVLTKGDIDDYSKDTIKTTFNPNAQEDEFGY
jgi:hypothetical protein